MNTDKIYAEQLANEYAPKDTSKVVMLRKLDARAKLPATIFTYTFGIIAALVTGVGMCLSMKVIGSGTTMFVLGVMIGMIGLFCMGVNYPIYEKFLAKGKQKYAFEIMQLAKEMRSDYETGEGDFEKAIIPAEGSIVFSSAGSIYCAHFHLCSGKTRELADVLDLQYVGLLSCYFSCCVIAML